MAIKRNEALESDDKYEMTPMIDVVFLLLIYFMFLPIQQEADLGITLPAETEPVEDVPLPSEAIIDILPNSVIQINGAPVDSPGSRTMPELTQRLVRARQAAERMGDNFVVIIQADADSPHQRTIDVMNACSAAGVRLVSFTLD